MSTDGNGITALVGAQGCPLNCKYCLNPLSKPFDCNNWITPMELYEKVKQDGLYYSATNGGITFGGGEPLLYADFIKSFRNIIPKEWNIYAETSLWIPSENIYILADVIDVFFIDIKDCNKDIYKSYTSQNNNKVLHNLRILLSLTGPDHIVVRIPLIPDYNTENDTNNSVELLKSMGITHFDMFKYLKKE